MEERINLVVEEGQKAQGVSGAVVASVVVHALLIVFLILSYKPVGSVDAKNVPIARYVELIKQNPKDFVEAPGRAVDKAPLNAPYSDANRRAAMPKPTGDTPTIRPGDGGQLYSPPAAPRTAGPKSAPQQAQQASPQSAAQQARQAQQASLPDDLTAPADNSRIPAYRASAAAGANVNWHDALRDIKVASLGGGQDLDLSKLGGGGDKGFTAEEGPLSFETQWYDWGAYAQSMVSRIRVNWYENMPQLIRTGMKGVVTIRFTINRDGSITDVTILNSSAVPPYDFAAKKAIELSSPLNPLPKDFPNPYERVTCMFFYNSDPPSR